MPDSLNAASIGEVPTAVPSISAEEVISPQRRDQIVDAVSAAEWDEFRDYPDVVIGRLKADEPFRILGGFTSGDALADLVLSLPKTACCFIAWHRHRSAS